MSVQMLFQWRDRQHVSTNAISVTWPTTCQYKCYFSDVTDNMSVQMLFQWRDRHHVSTNAISVTWPTTCQVQMLFQWRDRQHVKYKCYFSDVTDNISVQMLFQWRDRRQRVAARRRTKLRNNLKLSHRRSCKLDRFWYAVMTPLLVSRIHKHIRGMRTTEIDAHNLSKSFHSVE